MTDHFSIGLYFLSAFCVAWFIYLAKLAYETNARISSRRSFEDDCDVNFYGVEVMNQEGLALKNRPRVSAS